MTRNHSYLVAFFCLFLSLTAHANAKTITIKRNKAIKLKQNYVVLDEMGRKVAVAQVESCDEARCKLKVVKSVKAFQLKNSHRLELLAKKSNLNAGYLGYGGPLGGSLRLGFGRKFFNEKTLLTAKVTRQDYQASDVESSGLIFSVESVLYLFNFKNGLAFSPFFELGYTKVDLKFKEDSQGPTESLGTFFYTVGGELTYQFNPHWLAVGNVGVSKNGSSESYENSAGESYSNPYSSFLFLAEMGVRYVF